MKKRIYYSPELDMLIDRQDTKGNIWCDLCDLTNGNFIRPIRFYYIGEI